MRICFNPYCVGCNLRRLGLCVVALSINCFNPYCVGCNLRSHLMNFGVVISNLVSILIVLDVILEAVTKI